MKLGEIARKRLNFLTILAAAILFAAMPHGAMAQATAEADATAQNVADDTVPAADAAEASTTDVAPGASAYTPLGPDMIKGQPTPGAYGFQTQYTDDANYALWMHDAILMPLITIVSLFVLALILWVMFRYNRRSNPTPSKTSHNTLIEIIWTLVPVLILVVIAVPSITLLSRQFKSPAEDALTIKATGYQWYWGYTYPDNGGFEVISNMKDEAEAAAEGLPPQLAVDNRMVVPVGREIRIQTMGADVIHSFGIPSLWFKLDAVPGRLNERSLTITEPGIYYGQCMELCGARHGFMPIAIEAVPEAQFEAWVLSQGGTLGEPDAAATPQASPSQEPESSVEGAPGAGAAPTEDTAPTAETTA